MNILILGNANDAHATHVHDALAQRGVNPSYWDTAQFPTLSNLSWDLSTETGQINLPNGTDLSTELCLETIHSVYWRTFSGIKVPNLPDREQQRIAFYDAMSLMRSVLQLDTIHWVNSWNAYQFHQEKPRQLYAIQKLGVKIPATLISNQATQVIEFVRSHPKTIFKPVYGGAHTEFITAELLEPERLSLSLKISPITLQDYIPGTNIRSYVIANAVYSAEIRSEALDFRSDETTTLIPVTLPARIEQQCLAIAQTLGLEWTAIDWRLDPTGEYIFLEANPSPMFLYFEKQTGFPITQQLIQLLIQ
jgi:glutathione synthase/RimK-type ligase-like ATP-grasp enzyme